MIAHLGATGQRGNGPGVAVPDANGGERYTAEKQLGNYPSSGIECEGIEVRYDAPINSSGCGQGG